MFGTHLVLSRKIFNQRIPRQRQPANAVLCSAREHLECGMLQAASPQSFFFFLFYQGKNVRFQNPSAMTIVAWKLYRRPAHPHLVLFLEERLKFSVFSFPPASWKSSTTTKSFVSVLRSQRLCKLMRQLTTWRCSVSVLVRLSVAPPERFPLPSRREGNQGLFPTATKVSATIQQRTRTS